jgi:hypothetical protein
VRCGRGVNGGDGGSISNARAADQRTIWTLLISSSSRPSRWDKVEIEIGDAGIEDKIAQNGGGFIHAPVNFEQDGGAGRCRPGKLGSDNEAWEAVVLTHCDCRVNRLGGGELRTQVHHTRGGSWPGV